MVNNLQIIIHSPLINVQFPGNAFMIYEVMIQVATFDILPTDDWFPIVLTELPEEDPYSDKFDRLNYGSVFTIMNMGTMLIIFLYYALLYVIYPVMWFFARFSKRVRKLSSKLEDMLFWNHGIVFIQEGFLEIMIAAYINFDYMSKQDDPWSNSNIIFNNAVTIFLTAATFVLFLTIAFYLWPKIGQIKKRRFKKRYGSAYDTIRTNRSKWAMFTPLFFFVRRGLLVVAVCAMIEYPTFQILFFLLPTLVVMVNLGQVEPLSTRKENKLEMYNSWSILCLTYCLLCLTQFVPDAHARY